LSGSHEERRFACSRLTAASRGADTFYEYGPSTPFGPVEQLAIAACDIDLRGAIADVHAVQRIVDPGPLTVVAVEELQLPPARA